MTRDCSTAQYSTLLERLPPFVWLFVFFVLFSLPTLTHTSLMSFSHLRYNPELPVLQPPGVPYFPVLLGLME